MQQRELVKGMRETYAISERRACRIIAMSRSVLRYQVKKRDDAELIEALKVVSEAHPRWGFGKIAQYLRNQGKPWNRKRIYRLYRAMKLNFRIARRKRLPKRFPKELAEPTAPNECSSMDFMSDALLNGQRIRSLNVIDDFNREVLAIEVDTSLPAQRVVRVLEQIADWHGYPKRIRIDNGPEFIWTRLMTWAQEHQVMLDFIQPGKPAQNAYIERFNRTYREEVLDFYLFRSLNELRLITQRWISSYNQERPHDALNGMTPTAFRLAAC
jgi:putative transposase